MADKNNTDLPKLEQPTFQDSKNIQEKILQESRDNIRKNAETTDIKASTTEPVKDDNPVEKALKAEANAPVQPKKEIASIKEKVAVAKANKAVSADNVKKDDEKAAKKAAKEKESLNKKLGITYDDKGNMHVDLRKTLPPNSIRSYNHIADTLISLYKEIENNANEESRQDIAKQLYAFRRNVLINDGYVKDAIKMADADAADFYDKYVWSAKDPNKDVQKVKTEVKQPVKQKTPKTEVPKTEVPKTEVPKTEVPKTEVPKTEVKQPEIEQPKSSSEVEYYKKKAGLSLEGVKSAEELVDRAERIVSDYTERTNKKLESYEDVAKLKDFLPHYAISRYLNNEFGNIQPAKDKDGKVLKDDKGRKIWEDPASKKQADRTLAYFILDKIGAGLINASNMMNGLAPTQKSALQKYNETVLENAMKRDDSARQKTIENQINNEVKGMDAVREWVGGTVKLGNDALSRAISQGLDNINAVDALNVLKSKAKFFDKLSEEDKNNMVKVSLLTSGNYDDKAKALGRLMEADIELKYATTDAEKAAAMYNKKNYTLLTAYAEQHANINLNKAYAELDNLRAQNKLTDAQINNIIVQTEYHRKELEYLPKEQRLKLISGYTGIAFNAVNSASNLVDSIIPGKSKK